MLHCFEALAQGCHKAFLRCHNWYMGENCTVTLTVRDEAELIVIPVFIEAQAVLLTQGIQ
ncbi:hypothetical protein OA77_02910 [Pseudomonas coronafaciens]|nr:hypothetical protein OA77_02910 [Pseudomonas coronafaciens]